MTTNNYKVKVQFLRGSTTEDITDTINPVLKRAGFRYLTLHLGTNAVSMASRYIFNKLTQLKSFIMGSDKNCKVIISQPTLRSDNGKAAMTILQ